MARTRTVEATVSGPPAGIYIAEVGKVEDGIDGEFGAQVKFYFVIKKVIHSNDDAADEWIGKEKWAWASDLLTPRSKLFKWAKQILNNPGLTVEDDIDLDDLEGRACQITISMNDNDVLTVSDVAAYVPKKKRAAKPKPEPEPEPEDDEFDDDGSGVFVLGTDDEDEEEEDFD